MKNFFKYYYVHIALTVIILLLVLAISNKNSFGNRTPAYDTSGTTVTEINGSKTATDVVIAGGQIGAPMDNPTDMAAATSTLGTLPADTYYFVLTTVDADGGETAPSDEVSCSIGTELSATSTACLVTLTPNTKASSTRLWVSTTSGTYTSYLVATSSTLVATTTSLLTATIPTYNSAYYDIKIARYNVTEPTLNDGESNSLEVDNNGNLKIVEDGFSFYATSTNIGTRQLVTGSGVLHAVCINTPVASSVTAIYDATSATNKIASITLPGTLLDDGPSCAVYDTVFSTGLFLSVSGAASDITILYRQ